MTRRAWQRDLDHADLAAVHFDMPEFGVEGPVCGALGDVKLTPRTGDVTCSRCLRYIKSASEERNR